MHQYKIISCLFYLHRRLLKNNKRVIQYCLPVPTVSHKYPGSELGSTVCNESIRYTANERSAGTPFVRLLCFVFTESATRLRFPYLGALLLAVTDNNLCRLFKIKPLTNRLLLLIKNSDGCNAICKFVPVNRESSNSIFQHLFFCYLHYLPAMGKQEYRLCGRRFAGYSDLYSSQLHHHAVALHKPCSYACGKFCVMVLPLGRVITALQGCVPVGVNIKCPIPNFSD